MSITDAPNTFEDITTYNNFYEFGTDKSDPAAMLENFKPRPGASRSTAKPRSRATSRSKTS